ncbi:fasciclin domain-containing protein [Nocardia gipuzkoensis]|uniref:fasciclin domain-containing protein n=1 Tax=Nocardia gipuzkoensis TaxID=2749991 RepID=UPI001E37337E|nr:fasciclin domain-containing protein [Nocardia gipuzkoensis]UGT67281.1 fasciclin domain-containing protein [Nocardia gipuzkoensis]UGT67836.1 fasciclin domain-containing protein [Nocardia gipuzkoensis]
MRNAKRSLLLATALTATVLGASACTDDNDTSSATSTTSPAVTTSTATTSPPSTGTPASAPVGPGCAAYAEQVPTGPGSVTGMATEPVSVAASNNPMLTTLVAAVSGQLNPQVNLVGTLDGGQSTVFAPVDAAFAKVDPATIETLKTDSAALTKLLTYHVVPGRVGPGEIAGDHKTVEGSTVTVTGSGDNLKVADAGVICGGLQTANATVYLIDTVLTPPAA